jgi:hypothetical protein
VLALLNEDAIGEEHALIVREATRPQPGTQQAHALNRVNIVFGYPVIILLDKSVGYSDLTLDLGSFS